MKRAISIAGVILLAAALVSPVLAARGELQKGGLPGLEGEVATLNAEITALQSTVTTLQGAVDTLQTTLIAVRQNDWAVVSSDGKVIRMGSVPVTPTKLGTGV